VTKVMGCALMQQRWQKGLTGHEDEKSFAAARANANLRIEDAPKLIQAPQLYSVSRGLRVQTWN